MILFLLPNRQQFCGNTLILRLRKKFRQTKSAGKVMMIIFFDHKDVICQLAVSSKTTVNSESHGSVLKILRQNMSRKRPEMVGNLALHHGNNRLHVAISAPAIC